MEQPLSSSRWSSYPAYLAPRRKRPAWLRTDRFLAELQLHADTTATRQRLYEHMERWRAQEDDREDKPLRRGWFAGLAAEKERLLEVIQEQKSTAHYGEELRESDEQRAERLVREQLAIYRWTDALPVTRKGHEIKVRIAQVCAQSAMTISWIAGRLQMGTPSHLTHLLYWAKRRKKISRPRAGR